MDETHMRRALELALRGQGSVEPNPMVGAVVLDANGLQIAEGWHEKFGGPHAEVNAFSKAGELARGGTLFVTLEPCCHHGKTPPCSQAVIAAGIRRVVVAMRDPFPKVAGGGIRDLQEAGIEVVVGVCEREAMELNAPYLKLLRTGKPWVIAKWAMSLDGKIATRTGDSKWISGESSREHAHAIRRRVDAIIVGAGTVFADDPLLTARPAGDRVLHRVVVTRSGKLPEHCQLSLTARETPVIVFTSAVGAERLNGWKNDGAEVVVIEDPDELLADLGRRRFTNVLVEGGASLLGAFRDADLFDEVRIYLAPKLIGGTGAVSPLGGLGADGLDAGWTLGSVERIGGDVHIVARKFV